MDLDFGLHTKHYRTRTKACHLVIVLANEKMLVASLFESEVEICREQNISRTGSKFKCLLCLGKMRKMR